MSRSGEAAMDAKMGRRRKSKSSAWSSEMASEISAVSSEIGESSGLSGGAATRVVGLGSSGAGVARNVSLQSAVCAFGDFPDISADRAVR